MGRVLPPIPAKRPVAYLRGHALARLWAPVAAAGGDGTLAGMVRLDERGGVLP